MLPAGSLLTGSGPASPAPRRTGFHRIADGLRRIARLTLLLWAVITLSATVWVLSMNPFLHPYVERGAAQAKLRIEAAIARQVDLEWLTPRIEAALDKGDVQDLELLVGLAQEHDITLPETLQARVQTSREAHEGLWATMADCGRCMADMEACPSLTMISACNIPFELSPAGDVAALGRQAKATIAGDEVDEVEAALAAIGLVATGSSLISAGSTVPVKTSATLLRSARRARALTPGMRRALHAAATGARPAQDLQHIMSDISTVARSTSMAEVIPLLRYADDPADLRRIAGLSEVTRKDTRKTLKVLGKSKSLKLLRRVSDLVMFAVGLIGLVLGQIAALAAVLLKLALRQALKTRKSYYSR
ncbi:hypothetical protein [Paracoccus seriniphilus]|uniref:Uncharacterized protein n=1 Tax=Paracoccus seriniphilus TaxID=184748 RepID=A0A239PWQ5_9RHOB|nr:hypothetical protein [Paracoccus seriniphilus]WCR13173.1 hypothetical protein JHW44_09495 [Paracoccus seriniphilus]SNT74518.1 hypothetical protein SAMN05444959_10827 [Paracoccus seriniphilus]